MEWSVEHDGEYRARFTPAEDGLYQVAVGGTAKDGTDVDGGAASLRVAPSDAEYFDAAMRAPLLERLAEGNRRPLLPCERHRQVCPMRSAYSGKGITVVEERELWDMPIMLLLLLGLMGGEWWYPASARFGVAKSHGPKARPAFGTSWRPALQGRRWRGR